MQERRRSAWIGGMVVVTGKVVATEDLVIDGQIHGTIEVGDHNLTIGDVAMVVADLEGKSVVISGTVKGNVIGNDRVELKATAKVEGDIVTPKFLVADGASLSGKVDTWKKKPT